MNQKTLSYPMYAAAPGAIEGFWQGLRSHLLQAGFSDVDTDLLTPQDPARHWRDPSLLLSQTCGYPLTHALSGVVQLVGTPCYEAPGCSGPLYSSVFVVRADDPAETLENCRGKRVAFNASDSQSGYNSLRFCVAPLAQGGKFFSAAIESGAHRASMRLIQEHAADLAAIDCVTYALAADAGLTKGLRVLGVSDPAPGLPAITAGGASPETVHRLQRALAAACADTALDDFRAGMRLSGFSIVPLSAYQVIVDRELAAMELGYPDLV